MISSRYKKKAFAGALIGLGIQAVGGIANTISQARAAKLQREEMERAARMAEFQQADQMAKQYNQYYNIDGLKATARNGILVGGAGQNGLMKGSLKPISSGVGMLQGPSHEQGGIDLDADMDGMAEYELEGDEAMMENMVFSKRRKLNKEALAYLDQEGFKGMDGKTYAEAVEKLGKMQEKYEEKLESHNPFAMNTGRLMLERIDNCLRTLFMIQEASKSNGLV